MGPGMKYNEAYYDLVTNLRLLQLFSLATEVGQFNSLIFISKNLGCSGVGRIESNWYIQFFGYAFCRYWKLDHLCEASGEPCA